MGQLEDWFKPWVPHSVFSAGGGRGSVEAWHAAALDIEEVLSGAADSDVKLFVADVIKPFDTVDRSILDMVLSSIGLPAWFRNAYLSIMLMLGYGSSLLQDLGSLGPVMGASPGLPFEHDVHCCLGVGTLLLRRGLNLNCMLKTLCASLGTLVLSGAADSHVHLFVAYVVKSFDTVDRGILDRVLSSLGLPGWFRHAYFEYRAHVRLRFKLASGLGQSWTRDGDIPQGCPLSMMFIVALYLPWCRYLSAQVGVRPQLYADNLKCLSRDPDLLLHAARFTTGYVRLVGQEPAPIKCVLLSTSKAVGKDMKGWVMSQEGDKWSVKFDVRDLSGEEGREGGYVAYF